MMQGPAGLVRIVSRDRRYRIPEPGWPGWLDYRPGAIGTLLRRGLRRAGDRLLVAAGAEPTRFENPVLRDPVTRTVERLLGVGLEHDAFARSPSLRVHHRVIAHREFFLVVVRVGFGPQIDIALRPLQRTEVLAQLGRLGVAPDHARNHERGVDDLAESELLREIVRTTEQCSSRNLTIDQKLHALEEHAVVEG